MARAHNAPPPISAQVSQQAKEAIEKIKTSLLRRKFSLLGWFAKVIVIRNTKKEVPNTVFDAYHALTKNEKSHPLHALAAYYAHFIVATRPEYDHASRQKETKELYQDMAKIKGEDIFSDDPEAAALFNTLLQSEVMAICAERSPEQKEYLDFQEKVKIEIHNIQTMIGCFKVFEEYAIQLELESYPNITQEIIFIGQVIDRMRTAMSKEDIRLYARDAIRILDCMSAHGDEYLKNQIIQLQGSIKDFHNHHRELMTSLSDKKNTLYLSSALQATAIAVTSPLTHVIPVPSKEIVEAFRHPDLVERSIAPGTGAVLNAAAGQQEEAKVEKERSIVRHVPGLHNISEISTAKSLSDQYVHAREVAKDPEAQGKLATTAVCAIVSVAFPPLAVPIAVTSAVYSAGNVALNFFRKHNELDKLEQIATLERTQHRSQMQDFLAHATPKPPSQR